MQPKANVNRHCFRRRRNYYKRPFFNAPPPASQSHPYFDL